MIFIFSMHSSVAIYSYVITQQLAIAIVNCMFLTSGVLWPLEGLPRSIHWISNFMPVTYAVMAVKAVVSKGS